MLFYAGQIEAKTTAPPCLLCLQRGVSRSATFATFRAALEQRGASKKNIKATGQRGALLLAQIKLVKCDAAPGRHERQTRANFVNL